MAKKPKKKVSQELLSQAEYARRRGCGRSLISQLVKKGVLTLKDGKVDSKQADSILDGNGEKSKGLKYWDEHARLEKTKADLAEIELSKKLDELVEIKTVQEMLDNLHGVLRQRVLLIPSKIAPIIHGEETVAGVRLILEGEVTELLNELSSYDPETGKTKRQGETVRNDKAKRSKAKAS